LPYSYYLFYMYTYPFHVACKQSKQADRRPTRKSKQARYCKHKYPLRLSIRPSVRPFHPSIRRCGFSFLFNFQDCCWWFIQNKEGMAIPGRFWPGGEGGPGFLSLSFSLSPLVTIHPSLRLLSAYYIYIRKYIYTYARILKKHSRGARARDEPKQEPGIHAACK
jgi:hypothetical protein